MGELRTEILKIKENKMENYKDSSNLKRNIRWNTATKGDKEQKK
jgi:hypothetical protein